MSDSHEHLGFSAPDPVELNKLFPGYEIEGLIATGGMGAVYCAVQKSLDRTVALKILPQEFSTDAAFCAGFEAEAKAMARLNHPNLIGVYDFGEVGGMLFIIMEYVAGKSIYHSAHGQAIDPGEVIRLVTGVCNGLAHAHENGIIHRDIKPSNILLDLNAQPKIGDFGLARPIERKVEEGEEIFGTPGYTAPEVVNTPNAVDYRADIFSVGVLLHELLTGKLPADDRRPPSAISKCDSRFDVIVRRATHANPAGRYASAAEMAKDLAIIANNSGPRVHRAAIAGAPGHPGPRVAGPITPRRPVKVKKSSNSSLFILLLVLAAGGFGAYTYLNQLPAAPKPGQSQLPNASPAIPGPGIQPPPASADPEPVSDTPPVPESSLRPMPNPAPEAAPESDPATDAVPEETTLALPKYDVDGFLARARKIMHDKAKSYMADHEESLKANFNDFERALKRQARKAEINRDLLDAKIERRVARWKESGFLIPEETDQNLADIPDVDEIFAAYLEKEKTINATFQKSLLPLSGMYIQGMELQIGRLKTENDPPAIELIEKEISSTKESPEYFAELMTETAKSLEE